MNSPPLPRVWVLLGYGAGGNSQLLGLARALGWPFEAKRIRYNTLNRVPNLLLGATHITLDARRSDPLTPPWPDLVIAASRRAAPLARWIRKQSNGHTKLVHLLHAQVPLRHFDLVVTTAQYRLPQAANVLHNLLPLNLPLAPALNEAAVQWAPRLAHLPNPWIAVLVGGSSSSYRLSNDVAKRLAHHAEALARATGGSLLISTSPRTPAEVTETLARTVQIPSHIYRWDSQRGEENPHLGFLALADRFIVTCDSASLLAEACATGKPTTLFEWPPRRRHLLRLTRALTRLPMMARLQQALIGWGLIKPRRDFSALHAALRAQRLLDVAPPGEPAAPPDDLGRTVQRIRQLMVTPSQAQTPLETLSSQQA